MKLQRRKEWRGDRVTGCAKEKGAEGKQNGMHAAL
jgi:hypothetical protein